MRPHSDNSAATIVMPNGPTAVSQLQDIKEEEDVELTRIDSNGSCLSRNKDSTRSSLSSVMRHNIEKDANNNNTTIATSPTLSDTKPSTAGKTNSVDDLSLLPPLPNTIENVITTHAGLEIGINSMDPMNDDLINNPKNNMRYDNDLNNISSSVHSFNNILSTNSSPRHQVLNPTNSNPGILHTTEDKSEVAGTLGAPFDLSKALEIPNSFKNGTSVHSQDANANTYLNSINNSANNSDSSNSLSPTVTTPKVSKKKVGNGLLNSDMYILASQNPSPIEIPQLNDLKQSGTRNKSNSNATNFQNFLPNFNLGNDETSIESYTNENTNFFSSKLPNDKKITTRKCSIDNSSSSSFSNISISDELLYKLPPPNLHRISNSRSRSNSASNKNLATSTFSLDGLNHASSPTTSALNTPPTVGGFYTRDTNKNNKKLPLLRRASTAILRKTSFKNDGNKFDKDFNRSRSASTTPILANSSYFDVESIRRTPPLNKQRYCSSLIDNEDCIGYFPKYSTDSETPNDSLHYVTQLNEISNAPSRNPSIKSRVKRGFSRIISSSGSVKRAVSSTSLKPDMLADSNNDVSCFPEYEMGLSDNPSRVQSSPLGVFISGGRGSPVKKSIIESNNNAVATISHSDSNSTKRNSPLGSISKDRIITNVTPISTSTAMSPVASTLNQSSGNGDRRDGSFSIEMSNKGDPQSNKITNVSDFKVGSNENSSSKKLQVGVNTNEYDVTVDLDKLTKTIPVITITDKINSRTCVAIQDQSNISLDAVYMGRGKKTNETFSSGNENNFNNEAEKPEMMTLKEYVKILMKQQQIEDERLAILEKSFIESGWCSKEDIRAIKQKRVIISKKWAERISFYQSKLDF